ncbi:PKD-like family lipoprotein [Sphingobacterium sp. GVS05A]|uniref:PKD-like family lipoprotein n=1 Tax=Sphingobacterium sp. GVS05A TaxID=2862679 RepID=UPI001CBFB8E4|nr:PKD-like family lipoprotein [Sphingobacterium sp. GVS05A]
MKKLIISIIVSTLLASCYKDKGNYVIDMPESPVLQNLDTLYEAMTGDSLVIQPKIVGLAAENLECDWRIDVPEALVPEANHYKGNALRIVFGLEAKRYTARLTVTNKANGMKYFYPFKVQGVTEFSRGTLVLSKDQEESKLSFIKADNSVQPNIYEVINGQPLPAEPLQLHYVKNQFTGNTPLGYWIISKKGGVRLNVNSLKKESEKPGTLHDNFFLAPPTINVGSFQAHPQGVLLGVINDKFYGGATTTWDQSATYGMFGTYADGDYDLSSKFVLSTVNNNYTVIGFEKNKKQFVRINLYGSPMYFGTQYSAIGSDIFNPTNIGMDLLQLVQINNADTYAYVKNANGQIYELMFNANFAGPFNFTSGHKRLFIRPEWITADTKMLASRSGYIYIAAQNQIFRYNPLSEQVQSLKTDIKGEVTMLKLEDDESTLIAGAAGTLYYLDIQVGKSGELVKKIEGIPGSPIDMTWRK